MRFLGITFVAITLLAFVRIIVVIHAVMNLPMEKRKPLESLRESRALELPARFVCIFFFLNERRK